MRKLRAWVWIVAAVLLLGIVTRERQAFAAMTVGWSDFVRVDATYFAPSIPSAERQRLLLLLEEARQRVSQLYGPLRGRPQLIVSDAASMGRFSDTPTAVTHYQLNGAFTAIGPRGQNVDVMAHELAHAELYARIGYRKLVWCVPTWLDEGLAVQFDLRPTHAESAFQQRVHEGWPVPPLSQLTTHAGFFAGPRSVVRFHYATARKAVGAWLRTRGHVEAVRQIEKLDCSREAAAEIERIAQSLSGVAAKSR